MFAQVFAEVGEREVDVATASGVDEFGCDEAEPVLAGVIDVDAEGCWTSAILEGPSS